MEGIAGGRVIGAALSGGGVRGVVHIGVLKALHERGIFFDCISGTSAGAIVAALYATGYMPRQMEEIALGLKVREFIDLQLTAGDLFKQGIKNFLGKNDAYFWSQMPNGLIKGDKIEDFFRTLWRRRRLKHTHIPLAITAVDLLSADTVFFMTPQKTRAILNARYCTRAEIADAVRASIAIPGVFYPKRYKDMQLVDGAVKNNLPTDILHTMGADVIIAVDLGFAGKECGILKTAGDIMLRSIDIVNREVTLLKGEKYASVVLRPNTDAVDFTSETAVKAAVACGEKAVYDNWEEIESAMAV